MRRYGSLININPSVKHDVQKDISPMEILPLVQIHFYSTKKQSQVETIRCAIFHL